MVECKKVIFDKVDGIAVDMCGLNDSPCTVKYENRFECDSYEEPDSYYNGPEGE